jgi:hypothetical protein
MAVNVILLNVGIIIFETNGQGNKEVASLKVGWV